MIKKILISLLLCPLAFGFVARIPTGDLTKSVPVIAVDATDYHARETGLSTGWAVVWSLAGSLDTTMTSPAFTEVDATAMPGVYWLAIDESGMTTITSGDDSDTLLLHFSHASIDPVTVAVEIFRPKLTEGSTVTVTSGGVDVYTVRGAAPKTDADIEADALAALQDVGLHYFWDTAIPSQPTTGSWAGDLTEDDGGTQRFTTNALEQAAGGGGAGDASLANQTTMLANQTSMIASFTSQDAAIAVIDQNVDDIETLANSSNTLITDVQEDWATVLGQLVNILLDTGTTLDDKLDAAAVILAKVDGMLELDGAVYRLTENALEEGPGGGTGSDITIE